MKKKPQTWVSEYEMGREIRQQEKKLLKKIDMIDCSADGQILYDA